MKTNYASNVVAALLFTAFAGQAIAQPQITSAEMVPEIGTEHPMSQGFFLAQADGGANVTFPFGDMLPQSTMDLSVVGMNDVPQGGDLEGDYAIKRDPENSPADYQVFAHDAMAQQVIANVSTGDMSLVVNYTDPADILRFPMSYGDSYSDTYESEHTVNILGQDFLYKQIANMEVAYDAYGELILPSGAYEDVMRVSVGYETTVEIYLDGELQQTLEFDQTDYYYYQDNNPMYLCLFSRVEPNTGEVQESAFYYSPATSGLESGIPGVSLSAYPNPANDLLTLSIESGMERFLSIALYDTKGALVKSVDSRNVSSVDRVDLNVGDLESGVYILRLTDREGNSLEKRVSVAH